MFGVLKNYSWGMCRMGINRIILPLIIFTARIALSQGTQHEQSRYEIAINCYDTVWTENGDHPVQTKFIDLDKKNIITSIEIAREGELTEIQPMHVFCQGKACLISMTNTACYCKNTSVGDYNTHVAIIDSTSKTLLVSYDIPHQITIELYSLGDSLFFLGGSLENGPNHREIDEVCTIDSYYNIVNVMPIDQYTKPHVSPVLDFKVFNNIYFDIVDGQYRVFKRDREMQTIDSLLLEPLESRNMIFAGIDSILYVFSINYEVHIKGRDDKAYGQDWITPNVRRYNIDSFKMIDSIPIPDFKKDNFVSGDDGVARVFGPYITYYFGEPGDMELLYPAMLFIFDTRTNETTWLRVGWR
jgi:hypothetical protein